MSGYLQRLAEHALGQSKPLRVLTPPAWPGDKASGQAEEPAAALPHPVIRPPALGPFGQAPRSNGVDHRPPVGGRDSHTVAAGPTDTPSAGPPVALPAGTPLSDVRPWTAKATEERPAMPADSTPVLPEPPPLLAAQPLPSAQPIQAQSRQAARAAGESLTNDDAVPPELPAVPMPHPLLPRAEHLAHMLSPHQTLHPHPVGDSARQPIAAWEETTEVHVTIGRIEVTAVQEAPAQRPAPRRRNAPMSLDEYIARRQGGRS